MDTSRAHRPTVPQLLFRRLVVSRHKANLLRCNLGDHGYPRSGAPECAGRGFQYCSADVLGIEKSNQATRRSRVLPLRYIQCQYAPFVWRRGTQSFREDARRNHEGIG